MDKIIKEIISLWIEYLEDIDCKWKNRLKSDTEHRTDEYPEKPTFSGLMDFLVRKGVEEELQQDEANSQDK